MLAKHWNILDSRNVNRNAKNALHPVLKRVLELKGITKPEDIVEFLSDEPTRSYDPFLMKNMDLAVNSILEHVKANNKIVIFGDFDVDGITGTSLMLEFLTSLSANVEYYVPNRKEGYGLNLDVILHIKETMKADLLITVDCGISNYDEVELANAIGLEVIVTDHHTPPDVLPNCIILNPKLEGCQYPFKELCGCGVAFKFVHAIASELGIASDDMLNEKLDLVALATVADVVPLVDENRTLVKKGLRVLNDTKRPGLRTLIDKIGLSDKKITAGHVGYVLGPHFNAGGRVADPNIGVRLLVERNNKKLLDVYAYALAICNKKRKKLQLEAEDKCIDIIDNVYIEDNFLVVVVPNVSEGIIGIVAGRMRDKYYKPTLVITNTDDGTFKGSGRSIEGINLYEELKKNAELFDGFGGHKAACGFSISSLDKINILRNNLNKQADEIKNNNPDIFVPKIDIYAELIPQDLNRLFISQLERLGPFGMGNKTPYFIIRNIELNGWPETNIVGDDMAHLKLGGVADGISINGIGFDLADYFVNTLKYPKVVDIACTPSVNDFDGKKTVQVQIKDIRVANAS